MVITAKGTSQAHLHEDRSCIAGLRARRKEKSAPVQDPARCGRKRQGGTAWPIRSGFVIVGSGNIANTYVEVIRKLPDARLVGIVSRSGKRPSRLGDEPGVEVQPALREIEDARSTP